MGWVVKHWKAISIVAGAVVALAWRSAGAKTATGVALGKDPDGSSLSFTVIKTGGVGAGARSGTYQQVGEGEFSEIAPPTTYTDRQRAGVLSGGGGI